MIFADPFGSNTQAPEDGAVAATTGAPARAPNSRPDRHAERQKAHDYWEKAITALAISSETITMAQASLANNDTADASRFLEQGQKYAASARDTAGNERPDGWDDIGMHLGESAQEFDDALGHLRAYMDSNKASDGASALDSNDQAKNDLANATHEARERYISMGGKWSDLDDVETEQKAVDSLVRMMAGSGNGQ